MLKSHEKFHSENGKRLILVADDEAINRELLGFILQEDYTILFTENGIETLEKIRENHEILSLILLDLMMPGMSGLDVLKKLKEDPVLSMIPVIVITSDQKAEIESLTYGAIDFIPKPYPQPGVILARIRRTIELSEDRQIINSTERDPLTGLYNKDYFYRYAEQFDHHHRDMEMDAIVVDVNHFHMINERFGTGYGDGVLRRIGERVREIVRDTGGIVCRREADTFMVYCPHRQNYQDILENASIGLAGDDSVGNRVRLRMGVYANVDKSLDIERRFDRAKLAADTVKGSFTKTIGLYDGTLHEKELYAEQLIEDFSTAIEEKQFKVYYQPKFDVRTEIPVLASAEALVRWQHPKLGMISPGVFIPLFEENGLIQALDHYVWRSAAAQVRDWKDRYGICVPVSVNVSRIDMYDPHLYDSLVRIVKENGLTPGELLLEITESAYTQDSEQIIEVVNRLRAIGFKIEMDDFGTGYSSLNMISTLPIDALKLDMQFIRNAFNQRKDTRMLEVIIDIADYLNVPVIAEGVETEEQLRALKTMGCDLVQGYYFSRPLPAQEYEQFVKEKVEQGIEETPEKENRRKRPDSERSFDRITHALTSGFERIYYVDTLSHNYIEFSARGKTENLQIERSGPDFFEETRKNIPRIVYEEDRDRVEVSLRKESLLAQTAHSQPFSMAYRLLVDGEPVYYNIKAVRAGENDRHHVVIGVSNIDREIRDADTLHDKISLDFSSLAQALTRDMESIYYVDTITGTYTEFKTTGAYGDLQLEISGDSFFEECQKNLKKVVHPEDQMRVAAIMQREPLLTALKENGVHVLVYRLMIDGNPMYYRMKAVMAGGEDENHMIIGVSNVDSILSEEEKLDLRHQSSITFSTIAKALSRDYFSIYYVDTVTDRFLEFSSSDEYETLGIEKSGSDFFNLSRKNIHRVVHPDDVDMFLGVFSKEKILGELNANKTFTLTYRLMFGDTPTYVHMKATRMEDKNNAHIVIGVSNVDKQVRREQEHAAVLQMANQDALTGVKSKHAYMQVEKELNRLIEEGSEYPFAVVFCDVNGLKEVNDSQGHKAGDEHIRTACGIICKVFKHSPVFRIGGDEFTAVLRGSDFESRYELMNEMALKNKENSRSGRVTIAVGMADYRAGIDKSVGDVFVRADKLMYENKKLLKCIR